MEKTFNNGKFEHRLNSENLAANVPVVKVGMLEKAKSIATSKATIGFLIGAGITAAGYWVYNRFSGKKKSEEEASENEE